ncbi:MAG: PorT family protein [Cytophagaceae bacterium]|nr:PorT family protein [Cytophagaceae bacterium]
MRTLFFAFIILFCTNSYAQQEGNEFSDKPNPWGGPILDIGFNQYMDNPGEMDLDFTKSKVVNFSNYWALAFGKSNFSIASGLGLGLENYSFDDKSLRLSSYNDSLVLLNVPQLSPPFYHFKKSKLSANYLDIPVELRFETEKKPGSSFRIAVGGKFGLLFDGHTKAKYVNLANDETIKEKFHNNFGLRKFRYGLTARIGYGAINFFGYYSLTTLFEEGNGPQVTPYMLGISLSPGYLFD